MDNAPLKTADVSPRRPTTVVPSRMFAPAPVNAPSRRDSASHVSLTAAEPQKSESETYPVPTSTLSSAQVLAIAKPAMADVNQGQTLTVCVPSSARNGGGVNPTVAHVWRKPVMIAVSREPARKPAHARRRWESAFNPKVIPIQFTPHVEPLSIIGHAEDLVGGV